ncbi:MAG: pentapeptide repeat-containing protein [Alphaproteobacteria bacterium]|nr:pentapeptide repeat-containing protein [Alphaproteobacteria bacterium]
MSTERLDVQAATAMSRRIAEGQVRWNEFRLQMRQKADRSGILNLAGVQIPSNLNLSFYDFSDCLFDAADFSDVLLYKANFSGSRFRRVRFNRADLTDCRFDRSVLAAVDFSHARGAGISFAEGVGQGLLFAEADFSRASFHRFKGKELNFQKAILVFANFDRAQMPGANFFGADLRGASMQHVDLSAGSLEQAKIWRLETYGWKIRGIRCTISYIGQTGVTEQRYREGEFERKNSSDSVVVLDHKGGLDTESVTMLNAVIGRIKQRHPSVNIGIETVETSKGNTQFKLRLESNSAAPVEADEDHGSSDKSELTAATQMLKELKKQLDQAIREKSELLDYQELYRAQVEDFLRSHFDGEKDNKHAAVAAFDLVGFSNLRPDERSTLVSGMQKILANHLRNHMKQAEQKQNPPKTEGDSFVQVFPETVRQPGDDPEKHYDLFRAIDFCRSAMAALAEARISVRCGVSFGTVRAEYNTAEKRIAYQGDPFIEAVRLQSSANPGEILISRRLKLIVELRGKYVLAAREVTLAKGYRDNLGGSELKKGDKLICYRILAE